MQERHLEYLLALVRHAQTFWSAQKFLLTVLKASDQVPFIANGHKL